MKKKIIALLLTVVLCTVSLWGCGSSTYFKEVKEVMTSGNNIVECTFDIQTKGNVITYSTPIDTLDGTSVGVKTKAQTDDNGNFAVDIEARMKDSTEFDKVTTIVKESKYLYFSTEDLITFVEKYGLDPTGRLKTGLAQMGVKDWCKINIEQFCEMMKINYDEEMLDLSKHKDDISDYIDDVVDILDKDFNNLTSKDGDNYTLKIDGKNISTAIDDLVEFLDKDFKTVYDKTYDLFEEILGDDLTKDLPKYSDISSRVKSFKSDLESKKSKTIKSFKDKNGEVNSEVNADNNTLTFNFNGEENSDSVKMNLDLKTKKGNVDIKKLVPTDSVDLTAVFKSMQGQAGGSSNYNYGNSTLTY